MNSLKKQFNEKIITAFKKKYGYNNLEVPKLEKVVLNIGLGQGLKDPKFNEVTEKTLMRISGQKPIKTLAKKSISNFKIREGLVVGIKVTLRGEKMYDFVEKLIKVTLPRIRDFQGLSLNSVDNSGNLNIGIKEHICFPEIKSDEVEKIHGLEVSIITSTNNHQEGLELFRLLGFPFQET